MKKSVVLFQNPTDESPTEFVKVDSITCPFCRHDEHLWAESDLLVDGSTEGATISLGHFACEFCGAFFFLTNVDPDHSLAYSRVNLARFRQAPARL